MKEWIRQKLDEIDELFSKERLENSRQRYESIWTGSGKCDRLPFVYNPFLFNYYDDYISFENPDERLMLLLDECIIHGKLNDDFIPGLFPGCRQSTIPNMFGAEEVVVDGDFTCKKVIDEIEDIDKLPEPSISQGTIAYKWLELEKYYLEETDGRIPIHVCDMQGPFDVCGQLCGYDNLFVIAHTEPDYYHKLVGMVTKAFMEFWRRQEELLGDNFIGTHLFGWSWIPKGMGATLSADSIVMVSPDYFSEFYKPYLDDIGKNFGGLILHSCGDFKHLMGNIKALPYLKGINAGQMTLKQLTDAGLDSRHAAICFSEYEDVDNIFELAKEYSLRVDLTIKSIPFEEEKARHPELWSNKDWKVLKERDGILLEKCSRVMDY